MLTLRVHLCALYFLRIFRMMQYLKPEQIKLRTTIRTPLHQLEAIDIAFQWSITPRERESCEDSCAIPSNTCDKGLKFTYLAGLNLLKPVLKLFACSLCEHVHTSRNQLVRSFRFWACSSDEMEVLLLLLIQLARPSQKQPRRLPSRKVF